MVNEPMGWREVPTALSVIRVSVTEPIAVIMRNGEPDRVVTWPDLPLGSISPQVRIMSAPDGAWVLYTPMEQDEGPASQSTTAIHISSEGTFTRFLDLVGVRYLGATRHGLWLSAGPWGADVDTPAEWLANRDLLVLDAKGGRHRLTIDRIPAAVFDDGSAPHLVVYTSAPDASRDGYGGATYTYPYSRVDLPADVLPSTLRVAEFQPVRLEEGQVPGMSANGEFGMLPLDLGHPRASWYLIDLPSDEQRAAVEAVCGEFEHLTSYWTAPSGSTTPLSDGLGDARVEVVGEWPATRVEVSFTHPHHPEGRLRRTYRVFDDAGRITPTQFAAIHLMEDLDTRDLPPATNAHQGILDI